MNNDMKCPFCNGELKRDYYDCGMLECHNPKCKHYYDDFIGREELWQELIRTRKALYVAVDALKEITNNDYDADWQNDLAQATLEKIKDIK